MLVSTCIMSCVCVYRGRTSVIINIPSENIRRQAQECLLHPRTSFFPDTRTLVSLSLSLSLCNTLPFPFVPFYPRDYRFAVWSLRVPSSPPFVPFECLSFLWILSLLIPRRGYTCCWFFFVGRSSNATLFFVVFPKMNKGGRGSVFSK